MVVARLAGTIYIHQMFPGEPLLMVHQLTGLRPDVSNKQTNKKNGKNKLKLNVKECAHLAPNESLNKVF